MCCSFWPTKFSKTITGTWEVLIDGQINHVLWYQNSIGKGRMSGISDNVFEVIVRQAFQNAEWQKLCAGPMQVNRIEAAEVEAEVMHRRAGGASRRLSELRSSENMILKEGDGNCLIIPLSGTWESIRLLNTTGIESILEDIETALAPPIPDEARSFTAGVGSYGGSGIVFLQFSIYDIVIAQNASMLSSVLNQINLIKRPSINEEVLSTLESWYQCPVAICCFNNAETGSAKPIAFSFSPIFPDNIVVYTLDAHDGKPPDPNAMVQLDHTIFVGSYLSPASACARIKYGKSIPDHMKPFVLHHAMGTTVNSSLQNGDIVFSAHAVREGIFEGLRSLPPFAPGDLPRMGHKISREEAYVK